MSRKDPTEFRVVLHLLRGWKRKYWVQIKLRGSSGIGMFWYDVHNVTPHWQDGFRTKAEAISFKESLEKIWGVK